MHEMDLMFSCIDWEEGQRGRLSGFGTAEVQ